MSPPNYASFQDESLLVNWKHQLDRDSETLQMKGNLNCLRTYGIGILQSIPNESKNLKKSLKDVVTENEFEKKLLAEVIPPIDIGITFEDIGALENVKDTLKELVMLLLQRPELFCKGQLTKFFCLRVTKKMNKQEVKEKAREHERPMFICLQKYIKSESYPNKMHNVVSSKSFSRRKELKKGSQSNNATQTLSTRSKFDGYFDDDCDDDDTPGQGSSENSPQPINSESAADNLEFDPEVA
ncbi:hypothetical protein AgCh_025487 [Apium graveolens]